MIKKCSDDRKHATVFPWKSFNQNPATSRQVKTPAQLEAVLKNEEDNKSLFGAVQYSTNTSTFYLSLLLSLRDLAPERFIDYLNDRFLIDRIYFSICPVQAESTVLIGWFFQSHSNMNTRLMQKVITEKLGFSIELRWTMVFPGHPGPFSEREKKCKALHVRCNPDERHHIFKKLMDMYSTKNQYKDYPLGIKMRIVTTRNIPAESDNGKKIEELKNRQILWVENCINISMHEWIPNAIDFPVEQWDGLSFRQVINTIALAPRPTEVHHEWHPLTPMLHSFGPQYRRDIYAPTYLVAQVVPWFKDEAYQMVADLYPRLRHYVFEKYGPRGLEGIPRVATAEAIALHEETQWDPITEQAVTREDLEYAATLEDDNGLWEHLQEDVRQDTESDSGTENDDENEEDEEDTADEGADTGPGGRQRRSSTRRGRSLPRVSLSNTPILPNPGAFGLSTTDSISTTTQATGGTMRSFLRLGEYPQAPEGEETAATPLPVSQDIEEDDDSEYEDEVTEEEIRRELQRQKRRNRNRQNRSARNTARSSSATRRNREGRGRGGRGGGGTTTTAANTRNGPRSRRSSQDQQVSRLRTQAVASRARNSAGSRS